MLSQLSAVVLPVLLIAGIGFTWARMGRRFDSVFLTDIVTNIGTPCLVAHSLTDAGRSRPRRWRRWAWRC